MPEPITYTDEQAKAKLLNPINGRELAELMVAKLYLGLLEHQAFDAARAYPKTQVKFELGVELTVPTEVKPVVKFQVEYNLDLTVPPDLIRVLEGLPVFQKIRLKLAGAEVTIEKAEEPTPERVKGAEKAALSIIDEKKGKK